MKLSPYWFLFFFTSCSMAKYLPLRLEQTSYVVAGCSPTTPILMILFLITLLVGKLFILYPHQPGHTSLAKLTSAQIIPNQTAFVFDLHGVIFRFDPMRAVYDAVLTKNKKKLFLAAINPFLIWDVVKLMHTSAVVEEAIMAITHKYPNLKELVPLALQMANEQVPIAPTVELITQIKRSGFKLFVFSNIGEHSAQILNDKYPEIFALFDGVLVTTAQDNYLMKPSEDAFAKFLNKFNIDKTKIVFIDDKQSNIYMARKLGIPAIQFINPYQCRQLLQKIAPLVP